VFDRRPERAGPPPPAFGTLHIHEGHADHDGCLWRQALAHEGARVHPRIQGLEDMVALVEMVEPQTPGIGALSAQLDQHEVPGEASTYWPLLATGFIELSTTRATKQFRSDSHPFCVREAERDL